MPKYEVTIMKPWYTVYEVEAPNEDEASEIAWLEEDGAVEIDSYPGDEKESTVSEVNPISD